MINTIIYCDLGFTNIVYTIIPCKIKKNYIAVAFLVNLYLIHKYNYYFYFVEKLL